MIAVDSSIWIDFFRGQPTPGTETFKSLLADPAHEIIVPDLVLYEVLRGFRHEREYRQAKQLMESMSVESTAGQNICVAGAQHYRAMIGVGRTIRSAVDVLIAAFCIERSYTLLHSDRDFDALGEFRGLKCLDTSQARLSLKIH